MSRKIPDDAFSFYVSLGPDRSYQAVANRYGVTKRAVTKHAVRDDWAKRLQDIEREARQKNDAKLAETLEGMNERHLRIAKALQRKALEALMTMPIDQAKDVIRAIDLGVRQERLIRGEPTDRNAVSVQEVVRREYERWMATDDDDEEDDALASAPE